MLDFSKVTRGAFGLRPLKMLEFSHQKQYFYNFKYQDGSTPNKILVFATIVTQKDIYIPHICKYSKVLQYPKKILILFHMSSKIN